VILFRGIKNNKQYNKIEKSLDRIIQLIFIIPDRNNKMEKHDAINSLRERWEKVPYGKILVIYIWKL